MLAHQQPVEVTNKDTSYSYDPNTNTTTNVTTTTAINPNTIPANYTHTTPAYQRLDPDLLKDTQPQTRIFLRPIAAPSCLGFCMFFHSTFIVATYLASWWGRSDSQSVVWPFVAVAGLGQFMAGFWGFYARDHLACVVHVTWGGFFIAYGIQQFLIDLGYLSQ